MSKKHPKTQIAFSGPATTPLSHAAEYQIIRHDLVRVIVLNTIYLAGILALFYANNRTHVVDNFVARLFHF